MRRLLVLLGLLGVGAIATRRLLRSSEGTVSRAAQRSADAVRRVGPGAVDRAAQGVEWFGQAAEKGVQRIRRRTSESEEFTAEEAEAVLHADWLFQADGRPTVQRTLREIEWARELAARLKRNPKTPDLADEMAECLPRTLPIERLLQSTERAWSARQA